MDKIIVHFIFADESVMEFNSFEVALEYLYSYNAWKDDALREGFKDYMLSECDILKKVVVSGLTTSQELQFNSQIERISYSIN